MMRSNSRVWVSFIAAAAFAASACGPRTVTAKLVTRVPEVSAPAPTPTPPLPPPPPTKPVELPPTAAPRAVSSPAPARLPVPSASPTLARPSPSATATAHPTSPPPTFAPPTPTARSRPTPAAAALPPTPSPTRSATVSPVPPPVVAIAPTRAPVPVSTVPPARVIAVAPTAPPAIAPPASASPVSSPSPASLALQGDWAFRAAGTGGSVIAGTLRFKSGTAGLEGTYLGLRGNATQLSSLRVSGDSLSFDLVTPRAVWHMQGTISGDKIDGTFQTAERTVPWTAVRQAAGTSPTPLPRSP